jgi:hypothetical protein
MVHLRFQVARRRFQTGRLHFRMDDAVVQAGGVAARTDHAAVGAALTAPVSSA